MQAEGIPDFAALNPGYDRMPTWRGSGAGAVTPR